MCDYSLHHVSSRPAKISDKLVTTELGKSHIRGFTAVGEFGAKLVVHDGPTKVAVCLLPGTELAFDDDVQYDRRFSRLLGKARVKHKVARFREIDLDDPYVQHDALEFPNGQVLKLAQLVPDQTATVLQLPVAKQHSEHVERRSAARSPDSRIVLNRAVTRRAVVPNQGAVMLWQALSSAAVGLSGALVDSLRRLAPKPQPALAVDVDAEIGFDALTATLPKQPPAQKPERKVEVKAAV